MVDECRGNDIPVVVVYFGTDETRPFTYVATQSVTAQHILEWVMLHIDIQRDVVIEHNHQWVGPQWLLPLQPGDLISIRVLPYRWDHGYAATDMGTGTLVSSSQVTWDSQSSVVDSLQLHFPHDQDYDDTGLFQLAHSCSGSALAISDSEEDELVENFRWQEMLQRANARTVLHGYWALAEEAWAYYRSRRQWPTIKFQLIEPSGPDSFLQLDETFQWTERSFIGHAREHLRRTNALEQRLLLAVVRPIPTPSEQYEQDDLIVLVKEGLDLDHCLMYTVIWQQTMPMELQTSVDLLPCTLNREVFLQTFRLEEICESWNHDCKILHQGRELPWFIPWRAFQGMKVNIEVHTDLRQEARVLHGMWPYGFVQYITPDQTCDADAEGISVTDDAFHGVDTEDDDNVLLMQLCPLPPSQKIRRYIPFIEKQLRPWNTWRWPIRLPHDGHFLPPNKDYVQIQVRNIWSGGLPREPTIHFWTFRRHEHLVRMPTTCIMKDQSWTQIFWNIVYNHDLQLPVYFVPVTKRYEGDGTLHFLVLEHDDFYGGNRYFLAEQKCAAFQVTAVSVCFEACQAEHLIQTAEMDASRLDNGCALYGHTPRDRERVLRGQSLTLPTGSYFTFEQRSEERICEYDPAMANLIEGIAFVQIGASWSITPKHSQLGRSPDGVQRPWIVGDYMYMAWQLDPFEQLRPPGNPVWWLSYKLQCLDDYFVVGIHEIVIDAANSGHVNPVAASWSYGLTTCQQQRIQVEKDRQRSHACQRSGSDPSINMPVKISLWDHLQPNPRIEQAQSSPATMQPSVELPNLTPLLHDLLQKQMIVHHDWKQIRSLLGPTLHDEFDSLRIGRPDRFQEVIIYTDGSNTNDAEKSAAWALVVFFYDEGQLYLGDVDYGLVEIDPMSEGWTGATHADARSAEADALIKALEWCLCHGLEVPHALRYDSTSVGQPAAGQARIAESDKQLRILRALARSWDAYLGKEHACVWEHVRGHTGCLGNELADSLAKHAYHHQVVLRPGHRPDYVAYVFGKRYPIEMLWLFFEQTGRESLFPDFEGCKMNLPALRNEPDIKKKLPAVLMHEPQVRQTEQSYRLFAATFNVATLGQRQGTFFVQYLKEQMSAHGLDILFLQESRTRSNQMICSSTHIRIGCAASKGKGGVEIWISRRDPRTQKPVADKQHVRVTHADSELLLVCAKIKGVDLLLISGHAPHSGHPADTISAFWRQLAQLVKPHFDRHLPIICGLDANAHFAEAAEPYIGDVGLEKKTDHGAVCFLEFLRRFSLFLPSTFDRHHDGRHATWHSHATGAGARCDYFAIPLAWGQAFVRTQVLHTLDTSMAGADHSPLALDCKIVLKIDKALGFSHRFDRDALLNAKPEQLDKVFRDIQVPNWQEDPDVHAMQLSTQVQKNLQEVFPVRQSKPRASYISSETCNIRCARLKLRDKIRNLKDQLGRFTIHAAWQAWRTNCILSFNVGQAFASLREIVSIQRTIADTTKQLTKGLKADRVTALEVLANESQRMTPRDFMRALRSVGVGGRKKVSAIQPLPLLRDIDGHVFDTEAEHKQCWREYFAAQEDGKTTTFAQLFEEAAQSRTAACDISWENLPTAYQVEQKFRSTARGRAYYVDGIPGELLALAPKQMTDLYYTLMCKQVAYLHEPLVFKGGYLAPVYKKGDASRPENYRSLFVSSVIGKTVHSIYRNDLMDVFENTRLPFQIGGLTGQSILQAAHGLQSFHRGAVKANKAVGLLFIDVTNAFYRLVRQHLVAPQADRRGAAELFKTLGLPPATFHEFQSLLAQDAALDAAQTPLFLKELFKEFYAHTWFQVKSDHTVVESRRGSRPGDSFADLCFSFTLTQLLKPILETAREKYPQIEISWDGNACPYRTTQDHCPLGPLVPIWADDIAFAFTAATPDELLPLIQDVSGELFDGLLRAGLKPNFCPGKTELLLDLRGPNSLKLRCEMCHKDHTLLVPSRFDDYQLRLVGSYKHLGTWIQIGAGIALDARTKFAAAHELLTKYKGPVFSNRALPLQKKRQLFQTMILSTITFNAAAWMPRNRRQTQQLHVSFMKLYKRVCLLHFGSIALTWSDDKVLNAFRLPAPEITLRQARLRYVLQLCKGGQPHIWGLLQADDDWYTRFCTDIAWLVSHCPEVDLDPSTLCWESFAAHVQSSPARWKRLIKAAVNRHISTREIDLQWLTWQSEIMHEVIGAGFALPNVVNSCRQFYCLACRRSFQRQSDLSVHSFKKHQRKKPARRYVSGTTCEACLRTYPLHSDLINHVSRAVKCFHFYQERGLEVPCEPGVNSKKENQQRKGFREPYMQAEGPTCPEPDCAPVYIDQAFRQLQQSWDSASCERASPSYWLEQLRLATLETTLHHAEILSCFTEWSEKWCLSHQDVLIAELTVFAQFTSKASVEWFLSGDFQTETVAENACQFFQRAAWSFYDLYGKVSREVDYTPKVVAHLFSGERRHEDLQDHLERAGFQAISVDIIFDVCYGNLLKPETLQLFARALRCGALTGFVAGPPCETWSKARFAEIDGGPRPVRSVARPQGLQNLTKRETQQVSIGNQLLAVALKLFWIAIMSGSIAVIEHPAMPDGELPSIWRLPVIEFFLKFTTGFKLRVEQGRCGGLSPKPTDLLLANTCPDFKRLFMEGRTTPLPMTSRIGRGSDGTWQTSILKQYPSGFCSVLAALFRHATPACDTGEPIPDWFREATTKLVAHFNVDAPMGTFVLQL